MTGNNYQIIKRIYPDGNDKNSDIEFMGAGWGSRSAQTLRYKSILSLLNKYLKEYSERFSEKPKVLEVGCGFGVFYNMLPPVSYHGVDLNKQAVDYCKKKYGADLFSQLDITSDAFMQVLEDFRPDYLIASGVFDHKHIWDRIVKESFLHRLFDHTNYVLIGTMLYDVTPELYRNKNIDSLVVYTSPNEITDIFKDRIYKQEMHYNFKYDYLDNDYTFSLIHKKQLFLDDGYAAWKA